jgi:tetratricopeptide (TPR) repeat protein
MFVALQTECRPRGRLALSTAGRHDRAKANAGTGEEALVEAAYRTGDFARATDLLRRALEQSRAEGDPLTEAFALDRLGMAHHYRNIMDLIAGEEVSERDVLVEEELFRDALTIRRRHGDVAGVAQSLFGLGLVFQVLRGDWTAAMPYFSEALSLLERAGEDLDLLTRSEIHRHVGFYYLVEDVRPDRARTHLETSLALRERSGDDRLLPTALVALAQAVSAAGDRRRAVELLERAVDEARAASLLPVWVGQAEEALREIVLSAADDATTGLDSH